MVFAEVMKLRLLVTAVVLFGVVACGAEVPHTSEPTALGEVDDLDRFYGQVISWERCDSYATTATESAVYSLVDAAQCGRLDVPLDYADPDGRTARLAVLRLPAPGDRIGSLVINPGGPGGSGLFSAAAMGLTPEVSALAERFDIVGVDPRGVGASEPAIDCYTDAEFDRGAYLITSQNTTVQWTSEDTAAIAARCADASGGPDVLAAIGTRDAARDLDVLRAVLGDSKLTFLGQSYGTRLGPVYAEQFPQNVRAMLLDGALDPLTGSVERRVATYAGFQRSFDEMAAFCATQPDCPLGADPDASTAAFQDLVRPLYRTPVPALEAELGFDVAIDAVSSGLYTEAAWPRIVTGLRELRDGRGDELLRLAYEFGGRDGDGGWPNFYDALFAINCMDEQRLTAEQGDRLRAQTFAVAPFMDPGIPLVGARDACEHWPAQPNLGFPYATGISGLPPTLVVSVTGDPATPHAGGVRLAETLGSALLTVEGEAHGIVMAGTSPCVNDVAAAYLIDLELPEPGVTCRL